MSRKIYRRCNVCLKRLWFSNDSLCPSCRSEENTLKIHGISALQKEDVIEEDSSIVEQWKPLTHTYRIFRNNNADYHTPIASRWFLVIAAAVCLGILILLLSGCSKKETGNFRSYKEVYPNWEKDLKTNKYRADFYSKYGFKVLENGNVVKGEAQK